MAKHIVKCLYCGESFDANITPFVKVNSRRYAHQSCAQTAEENKSQEEKDKETLEAYIKELLKISSITPKIHKQMEMYKEQYNYSYSGMYKTLKYFYEVRGNNTDKANGGIGIIPYAYNEAFMYWRALWEAQQKNEKVQIEQYLAPVREIHIQPPERQPLKRIRRLFTFLEDGEE